MNTQVLNTALKDFVIENPWIVLVAIWVLTWKAIALWKSARNNHLVIFILLTVLNTAGIAEIFYLTYLYYKNYKKETASQ